MLDQIAPGRRALVDPHSQRGCLRAASRVNASVRMAVQSSGVSALSGPFSPSRSAASRVSSALHRSSVSGVNYLGRLAPLFFRGRVSYVLVWEGVPHQGRGGRRWGHCRGFADTRGGDIDPPAPTHPEGVSGRASAQTPGKALDVRGIAFTGGTPQGRASVMGHLQEKASRSRHAPALRANEAAFRARRQRPPALAM